MSPSAVSSAAPTGGPVSVLLNSLRLHRNKGDLTDGFSFVRLRTRLCLCIGFGWGAVDLPTALSLADDDGVDEADEEEAAAGCGGLRFRSPAPLSVSSGASGVFTGSMNETLKGASGVEGLALDESVEG